MVAFKGHKEGWGTKLLGSSAHTLILSFSNGFRTLRGFDISSGQMAVRAGAPVVQDLLQNNYDSRNFLQQAGRLLPFIVV